MARADKDENRLIRVASRAHTAVVVTAPPENPDKPGLMPADSSLVLHGASHLDARNGVMINDNVHAKTFRAWHEHQKAANTPLAQLVYEVPDDYKGEDDPGSFGWEPALEVMSGDKASGDGSTTTHEPPLRASEMAATSDTPDDGSPRSDPDVLPVKRSQKSASATIAEELAKK